jgi:membrane protein implicated in regulation of membrane protease activity
VKLHTAALVASTLWLGSLLAVVVGPHPSVAHLAVYAWWSFLGLSAALVAVLLAAAYHVVGLMLKDDELNENVPPDFSDSQIHWLDREQPNPRVRAGS